MRSPEEGRAREDGVVLDLLPDLVFGAGMDELRLQLFPVVVASGARLFESYSGRLGLDLADAQTFQNGVVNLVYRPASG